MSKTCFVIMPITDQDPYPLGHFKLVYEQIIKPACEKAGFLLIRADDIENTNYIALDIIRRIVDSDMAICDLSGRNPNVLYELGIRQAFDLPITLIKDSCTSRIFDIQGIRDLEYNEAMRIDNVMAFRESLATTLLNTYESRGKEVNSLISLLGIQAAKVSERLEISNDTQLILNSISNLGLRINEIESKNATTPGNPTYSLPNSLVKIPFDKYHTIGANEPVYHQKFGKGFIREVEGGSGNLVLTIMFDEVGLKKIIANYAKLFYRGEAAQALAK